MIETYHYARFSVQTAIAKENVGGAIWQAVLPLLNNFAARAGLWPHRPYNGTEPGDGADRLSATMREILSKSLTLCGFIFNEFAGQLYAEFLREVEAGVADGIIRYREDIVDGLEKAPACGYHARGAHRSRRGSPDRRGAPERTRRDSRDGAA
jgi:NADPH-dependent curcumin reductase CurA